MQNRCFQFAVVLFLQIEMVSAWTLKLYDRKTKKSETISKKDDFFIIPKDKLPKGYSCHIGREPMKGPKVDSRYVTCGSHFGSSTKCKRGSYPAEFEIYPLEEDEPHVSFILSCD